MPAARICGNPLFRDWMDVERKIAQDKGLKSAETYGAAWKSLAACPVQYNHPRDLVCLVGIGPKIVDILTRKWRIHCEENGLDLEPTPKKKRPKARSPSLGGSGDEDPGAAGKPKKKKAAPKVPKSYIPQPRSGAYALLLGLVIAIDEPTRSTTVYQTKTELIRLAQPYSDASFTHSEKGTYYNAWNSMKTLVNKGYIYVTGNPHKYCLTEEGYEVACAVRALHPEFEDLERHPFLHESIPGLGVAGPSRPRSPHTAAVRTEARPPQSAIVKKRASDGDSRRTSGPERFQFWYISATGDRVEALSAATIRLDPDEFVNLRKLEFRFDQRNHPFARQLRLVDTESQLRDDTNQPTFFGYMPEEGAPPKCSKFDVESVMEEVTGAGAPVERANKRKKTPEIEDVSDDDFVTHPGVARNNSGPLPGSRPSALPPRLAETTFARTHSAPVAGSTEPSRSVSQIAADAAARRLGGVSGPSMTASLSAIPGAWKPARPAPRLSSHVPIHNPLAGANDTPLNVNIPDFDTSSASIFPAGSYEIILIVDTREVESKSSRDKITETLLARGVKVETRALRLGDMCWIARRLDGMGGEEDECVLDYVVERKRLDDLCSSIKDGRYTEQCFRLTNSCIQHIYYIVEDFQVAERMEYNGLQIMTAKSQIQVHNRFFLKETHKLNETIDFLKTMTDVIVSLHARSDLHVIPTKYLSRSTYSALQAKLRTDTPYRSHLISWEAYQELNDKSASQTLKEKFARMFLCMKGMSAERVSAILDIWETPRALWEDLKAHDAAEAAAVAPGAMTGGDGADGGGAKAKKKARGKEMFFADRVQGEGRRKIGDALSKELYRNLMGGEVAA